MSKLKTYVALILDQSGSMSGTKTQAVQGYNEQVQQMKLNAKDQDIFCSLVTFNGEVFEHQWCKKASELNEATAEDYMTEGTTALHDAVGYTVDKLMKTTDTKDKNTAYLIVIISDGENNSSQHYSVESLRELIESAQKSGKWTFTYMGCDEAYLKKIAKETSIPISNMALWSNATPKLASRGMHRNKKCLDAYYDNRKRGRTSNTNVYSCSNSMADFTAESVVDTVNKQLLIDPLANIDVTFSNDIKPVDVNVKPFNNHSPVNWQA